MLFYKTKKKKRNLYLLLSLLLLLTAVSVFIGIAFGSTKIGTGEIFNILFANTDDSIHSYIILKLRLPRTLCAFTVGALLSLSGAIMQILLQNPLADPYILGVSGGAASGRLVAILLYGVATKYLGVWSFFGSLISILTVIAISYSYRKISSIYLLLSGVIVASMWSALIGFFLTITMDQNVKNLLFWFIGDLSGAVFSYWHIFLLVLIAFICLLISPQLNILIRGELIAKTLGVNVLILKLFLYFSSSLLTASAVTIGGCIGFIGLIVPHILRLTGVTNCNFLLPFSVLLGGNLLMLSDTLSRTIIAPTQLPVGILTALIGAPFFLFLLRREIVNDRTNY